MAVFRIEKNKRLYCDVKSSLMKQKFIIKGKRAIIPYSVFARRMGLYNKRTCLHLQRGH